MYVLCRFPQHEYLGKVNRFLDNIENFENQNTIKQQLFTLH